MRDPTGDVDEGRGRLASRLEPIPVPESLRDRVRGSLFARGLLENRNAGRARSVVLLGGAAACFLAGVLADRGASWLENRSAPAARYALILYGGLSSDTGTLHLARVREYGNWASSLPGDARFVNGHELGSVVEDLSGVLASPPPNSQPVAGFFIIDAPSAAVAKRIARDCPHLKYGGRVVLQVVDS